MKKPATDSLIAETTTPAQEADRGVEGASEIKCDNPSGTADNLDGVVLPQSPPVLPIIGLGGSAGGIEALREFFHRMPSDCDLAFVVVVHLAPDHESTLAHLLQQHTAMPVVTGD